MDLIKHVPHTTHAVWAEDTCPTTGRFHLHAYLAFDRGIRQGTLRKLLPGAHLIACRSNLDALRLKRYVLAKHPFYASGTDLSSRGQGTRTDIVEFRDAIIAGSNDLELLMKFPNQFFRYYKVITYIRTLLPPRDPHPVTVEVWWGITGSGKSWTALTTDPRNSFVLRPRNTGTWFDGYVGQRILIIDEFRANLPFELFKMITDPAGFDLTMDAKFGSARCNWEIVLVISNYPINLWYRGVPPAFRSPLLRRLSNRFWWGCGYTSPARHGRFIFDGVLNQLMEDFYEKLWHQPV